MRERLAHARALVAQGLSVAEACRRVGMSRSSYYRRRRPRPRRPLDPHRERLILDVARQYPAWGYRKLAAALRRRGVGITPKTVYRYLKRHRLLQPRRRSRSGGRQRRLPLSCPIRSNVRWELDIKSEILHDGSWAFLFALVDAYDRELLSWAVGSRCRHQEALAVLEAGLARRFGGPAPRGLHLTLRVDRGSAFVAEPFRAACRTLGVERELCGVRCSNDKPYVESFFAAVEREVLAREPDALRSLEAFRTAMDQFARLYTTERPLGTMGYQTPQELADRGGAYAHHARNPTQLRCAA